MIDAMRAALEALEYHQEQTRPIHKTQETITALRQAIEQAEQWDTSDMAYRPNGLSVEQPVKSYTGGEPQYATDAPKREWQGLSDEEVAIYSDMFNGVRLMKAVEALLKRRNT
jgi:hypothetical protein